MADVLMVSSSQNDDRLHKDVHRACKLPMMWYADAIYIRMIDSFCRFIQPALLNTSILKYNLIYFVIVIELVTFTIMGEQTTVR